MELKKISTTAATLQFLGANQMILNDEYAGLCLQYYAIHGEEDKKNMVSPQQQEQFNQDFEDFVDA